MIMSKINYIKSNLLSLFKIIVYSIILKYYRVNSSNVQVVEYDLNNNYKLIISSLKEVGLVHLLELVENFYRFLPLSNLNLIFMDFNWDPIDKY